jgi:beta-glucosidase
MQGAFASATKSIFSQGGGGVGDDKPDKRARGSDAGSNKRLDDLLASLTLDEKISLMSGADMWSTPSLPHHNIAKLKMTDGPNGARGGFGSDVKAACFPVGVALAATWNKALVQNVGEALGEEAKTKGAQVLLGPTINLQRTPVGGRNFECFSEDPILTGDLAVSYINGVQSEGVAACPKHFVANDTEFERQSISSDVDERTLRELYLLPFEAAVKDGDAWSIMTAYNKINGVFASSHDELLNGVVRSEWGFDGVFISDWGAALETVTNANGGLDLEMPGPARSWGRKLRKAVDDGHVSLDVIDQHASRLLLLLDRVGLFDTTPDYTERAQNLPTHRILARQAAVESMILAKNDDNILPLNPTKISSLAVIGPNAKVSQIQGGGSSSLRPHYVVNALDGLVEGFDGCNISFEPGCQTHKFMPAFDARSITSTNDELGGFTSECYANETFSGEPEVTLETRSRIFLFGAIGVTGAAAGVSIRLSGFYVPKVCGSHTFGITSAGQARLYVDGKELVDNWTSQAPGDSFFGFGSAERLASTELVAGRAYFIQIDFVRSTDAILGGLRFGVLPPLQDNLIDRAVLAAQSSDQTILVLGTNDDWETEGTDRTNMQFPGDQNALAEAVLDADPNTIIVVNAGAPMEMPWFDRVKSLLWVWFPGQEFGNALFDVITGAQEPSGRSPISFPKQLQDHPAFPHYPGVNGHMAYEEKLLMGYRYYDGENTPQPLIPFGHGLGYADIEFNSLECPDTVNAGSTVDLQVTARNGSERSGEAVLQLYIRPVRPKVERPIKELKAFEKVSLSAGASTQVSFSLSARSFSYWSVADGDWCLDSGDYEIMIGKSSSDIVLSKTIRVQS